MKKILILFLAIVTVNLCTFLYAQEEYIPLPDVAGDPDLATAEKPVQPFTLRYGGWITPVVIDQRTTDTDLMTSITTARVWLSSTLWANASLYVRVKDSFLAVIREQDVNIDNTSNVFDLDIAQVTIPVMKNKMRLVLGRKYYVTGAGLALNGRGDGGEVQLYSKYGDLKAFGMYSGLLNKDDNPYGLSSRDIADGAKRIFAGAQYSKDFLFNNTVYLYGLMEIDKQDEEANNKSTYDAQYIGAGVKGVVSDSLSYYAEYVYQMGTSYATIVPGVQEESDIKAMAVLAGLRYFIKAAYRPLINLQYAYGSGDEDATSYSNATGNTLDDDTRFMYFGTFLGGFALRPQLGNLHVIRPGIGFSPFYNGGDRIKALNLVLYYTYYMKDKKESPISGGDAPLPESFVGQGVDLMLRWPVYYDFSFFANYGLFLPGDAYPSGTPERHFIMAGVNIVF
ncbi:MAG TPA: alginate export family protein [Spirochaetota bacterium]|nr:alginate export family protein [Spirochaetota bacterium]HOM11209.1 alginate export family protein [Spirochaetota bacterium]HPP50463.1 alginate export family protein [Spirochaetota bacterium]